MAALSHLAVNEPVVFPLHPRTQKALGALDFDLDRQSGDGKLTFIRPLGYLDLIRLASSARGILTDSGGLQKEAYFLGVPCVTLRDETEWTETVDSGWNRLAGADTARIRDAVASLKAPGSRPDLAFYGDGRAAEVVARLVGELAR